MRLTVVASQVMVKLGAWLRALADTTSKWAVETWQSLSVVLERLKSPGKR